MKRPHHISEILNFKHIKEYYYIYTDHRTQLEYLNSGKEISEQGFKIHLFGYQYRVCLKFREVYDADNKYEKLYYLLNGKGVSSIHEAIKEMELLPLHSRYENFFSSDTVEKIREYLAYKTDKTKKAEEISLPGKIDKELQLLVEEFSSFTNGKESPEKIEKRYHDDLSKSRDFFQFWITHNQRKNVTKWMKNIDELLPVNNKLVIDRDYLTFINLTVLKQLLNKKTDQVKIDLLFDDLLLSKPITNILEKYSNGTSIFQRVELIKLLLFTFLKEKKKTAKAKEIKKASGKKSPNTEDENVLPAIKGLLDEDIVHNFIHVNEFEGITYFNKERFEELLKWLMLFNMVETSASIKSFKKERRLNVTELNREINKSLKLKSEEFLKIINNAESCGYDFTKFRNELNYTGDLIKKKVINKKRKKV